MLVGFPYLLGILRKMELRHLRYFVAVGEEQSITRAAARLHVSQPPLSRQIRDLEEELGVQLLERGARQVALTAAGKAFFCDARKLLAFAAAAVKRARHAAQKRGSELRIGYSPTPTAELLPAALELFQTAEPVAQTLLLDLATDEMIAAVRAKSLDLAVFARPPGERFERLEFRKLFELPVGIIVPPRHRLVKRRSVSLDEVLTEPIVAFIREGYSDYHGWLASVLRLATVKPRLLAKADGAASLIAAVRSGQGIAFGPRAFEVSFGGRVKYVALSTPVPRLEVGLLMRKEKPGALLASFVCALESAANGTKER